VKVALARYRNAERAAGAYAGEVLKAAQDNMELVTEAYRAGKVNFLELVLIQRQTLDARRGYIDALQELNSAEAQLKRVTGTIP
jgi:cobalt-zinc-cadmium efflux system outer membrane protein